MTLREFTKEAVSGAWLGRMARSGLGKRLTAAAGASRKGAAKILSKTKKQLTRIKGQVRSRPDQFGRAAEKTLTRGPEGKALTSWVKSVPDPVGKTKRKSFQRWVARRAKGKA